MSNDDKAYGPRGTYIGVITEHKEYGGRGPRRGVMEVCDRNRNGEAMWRFCTVIDWERELPPIGTAVEVGGTLIAEQYNGKLRMELSLATAKPCAIGEAHAQVPMPERGGRGASRPGPTASQVQAQDSRPEPGWGRE